MRIKMFLYKALIPLTIVTTLLALTACRKEEQVEEVTPAAEPVVQVTEPPAPSPTTPEPTTEASTEKLTDEATTVVEPTATEATPIEPADMEEYVSFTDFFSLKFPNSWSTQEAVPGANFVMANSEAALERYRSGSTLEYGDLVLNIGFLPYRLLESNELRSIDFQYDAPPDVFLQSLLPMFRIKDDLVFSESELVSLASERDAGLMTVSAADQEGLILMFPAGDSVIALVSAVTSPGDMDEYQEIAYAVAAEVAFNGPQDALYGALLGG